jgi:hypothetical protein
VGSESAFGGSRLRAEASARLTSPRKAEASHLQEDTFEPEEELYRRYTSDHWTAGVFTGVALRFPNPSFNRSSLSSPTEVLRDGPKRFDGWGVLGCYVLDVPKKVVSATQEVFEFFARYDPLPTNPAHSVIAHMPRTDEPLPPLVKKQVRTRLGQRMRMLISAEI